MNRILVALIALSATTGCMRKPVFFETGMSQFEADDTYSEKAVKRTAQRLRVTPWSNVVVVGLTDIQGDTGANKTLSEKRAEYVKSQLVAEGVSADRISVAGVGEVEARRERAIDRRVEFVYHPKRKDAPDEASLKERFGK